MSAAAERELLGPETEILAPELEALINSATDKLDAAAVEAKLSDDPLQVHLIALKYVLKALRRLFVDGALKLAREIRNAQQPVQNKELMQAFKQGVVAVAGDFIGQMRLRFYLTGAGLLVGMFLIGLAIGWYEMTSRVEALNQTMNAATAS